MVRHIARMPVRLKSKHPDQGELVLQVERQIDRDGVGMGVLRDGTPFLNQRGIALLCGLRNKYIGLISSGWNDESPPIAAQRVKELVAVQGVQVPTSAHIETFYGKVRVLAYPDAVCMAILEYYAFEADLSGKAIALDNYKRLARFGLRQFIYNETGYSKRDDNDLWRIFKDRVSLTYDSVPSGYFSVFKELASLIVTLGLNGLHIDDKFVPDISVGQGWGKHWQDANLGGQFGTRGTYPHNYPSYFPQAASNPQMAACYPEIALGEFRRWFREDYIGEGRFKKYLERKVNDKLLPEGYVERAMIALTKE